MSAILDELVELAVRCSKVNVALAVVLGRFVDLAPSCPQLGDRLIETLDPKADRAVRLAHAARIGDCEQGSIR